jgi:N-sulfoglucosamine sulfohydrolase
MIRLLTSFVASVCLVLGAHAAAKTPNILWLVAEDFGPHLGCYGTKEVHTPNLDRLASEGVRYTRFFTTAPVCSPSRSAFMTGMYQTTIGAHQHRSHRDDDFTLPAGVRVLSDWMREADYFTANIRELPSHMKFRGTGNNQLKLTKSCIRFRSVGRLENQSAVLRADQLPGNASQVQGTETR